MRDLAVTTGRLQLFMRVYIGRGVHVIWWAPVREARVFMDGLMYEPLR